MTAFKTVSLVTPCAESAFEASPPRSVTMARSRCSTETNSSFISRASFMAASIMALSLGET